RHQVAHFLGIEAPILLSDGANRKSCGLTTPPTLHIPANQETCHEEQRKGDCFEPRFDLELGSLSWTCEFGDRWADGRSGACRAATRAACNVLSPTTIATPRRPTRSESTHPARAA